MLYRFGRMLTTDFDFKNHHRAMTSGNTLPLSAIFFFIIFLFFYHTLFLFIQYAYVGAHDFFLGSNGGRGAGALPKYHYRPAPFGQTLERVSAEPYVIFYFF